MRLTQRVESKTPSCLQRVVVYFLFLQRYVGKKMRLLKTRTLQLEEFVGQPPPYAILSHTWEQEEVTFQDIQGPEAVKKKGYAKLQQSSKQALLDGHRYIWIDTCCIDKSSSTELSEAINSMFRWYERAKVCYAYLHDVPSGSLATGNNSFLGGRNGSHGAGRFRGFWHRDMWSSTTAHGPK